jgi:hypothetical protein
MVQMTLKFSSFSGGLQMEIDYPLHFVFRFYLIVHICLSPAERLADFSLMRMIVTLFLVRENISNDMSAATSPSFVLPFFWSSTPLWLCVRDFQRRNNCAQSNDLLINLLFFKKLETLIYFPKLPVRIRRFDESIAYRSIIGFNWWLIDLLAQFCFPLTVTFSCCEDDLRMPRKIAFSAKAKKKQLQAKREEKRDVKDLPFGERRRCHHFEKISFCHALFPF